MKDTEPEIGRRRRSCYDRARMRILERRRTKLSNPAQSAALQLLALFATVFGRVPVPEPVATRYIAPPMSAGHTRRLDRAHRLGVASRYVDLVEAQRVVPYAVLFDQIRRGGRARRDAVAELRKRVPEASLDWLAHIERSELWVEVLRCHVPNAPDDETDLRILKSTLAWIDAETAGGSGPVGANPTPSPSGKSRSVDEDDDPLKPKP